MVDQLSSFAAEVTRVAKEVGNEGKLGGQAEVRGVSGTWKDLTENVNVLAGNLTNQVRNIAKVTTAVANGDLSQKITVDARGEVYELNLCQEFYAKGVTLDPADVFERLNAASPAPFAGFLRWREHYLLCASPERFVAGHGGQIISQPIKGTTRRGATPAEDEQQRENLLHDEKERAENLMIVDLVRNDLARVAQTGTVRVPELFGLYPFRHLWQMISTVTADLHPATNLVDILCATFPMGSMTGAPKINAMKLIETIEVSRRGLYSGALGYKNIFS